MKKVGFLVGVASITAVGVMVAAKNKKNNRQPDINLPEIRFDEQVDQVLELSKEVLKDAKETVYQATDTVFGTGTGDQLKGTMKKAQGKLTGNRKAQIEGAFYTELGKAKSTLSETVSKFKDELQ